MGLSDWCVDVVEDDNKHCSVGDQFMSCLFGGLLGYCMRDVE